MVGREHEIGLLRSLLDEARSGRSQVLVIEGEAGIGKSTLLREADRLAEGFTCLWAHGVEGEDASGHSGLLEALSPLRGLVPELPSGQAAVLDSALGWGPATTQGDAFLLAAATLSLLSRAAARRPVLLLVDDMQWLDQGSARALVFAARRTVSESIAVVVGVRAGTEVELLRGLPAHPLGGLTPPEAAGLLSDRFPATVLSGLVERTGGNPLALLESAGRLTSGQRSGAERLPDELPTGPGVLRSYEKTLSTLSEEARMAVLLVAAEPHPVTAVVIGAMRLRGVDVPRALDEAELRGVVGGVRQRVTLRHPLLRTAALRAASAAELRAAHAALAQSWTDHGEDSRRVWHEAEAAIGSDDRVADDLVRVAGEQRARQGFAAASAGLERAAQLTGDRATAATRQAAAVHDAFMAGDVDRVRALAAEVLRAPAPKAARAAVRYDLGTLEQYVGSVSRAADTLSLAVDESDGALRVHALAELALCLFRLGDVPGILTCARRLVAGADRSDAAQDLLATFIDGMAKTLTGEQEAARPLLHSAIDLAAAPSLRDDPRYLIHLSLAAGLLGDSRHAMAVGTPLLAQARERGAVGVLVPVLAMAAHGRAWVGDHAGAFADAGEAVELGELLGYTADVAVALEMVAWQLAARGRHEASAAALSRARTLLGRAQTSEVAAHLALNQAFCALCRGDMRECAEVLEARIAADGGVGAMGEPLGVAPLLVESYLALGRRAEAVDLTARLVGVTPEGASPATQALVQRCIALTAPGSDAAVAAFDAAMAAHAQGLDAFEQARTRLLLGERLRRDGQRSSSREHLRAAQQAFEAMGLTLWSARAADELAASGLSARDRRAYAVEPLTSQETRVALMVAQGLSNRDVAAALFLSPKTVEHHLSRVYRKRGFRSRTQLVAALAGRAVLEG